MYYESSRLLSEVTGAKNIDKVNWLENLQGNLNEKHRTKLLTNAHHE